MRGYPQFSFWISIAADMIHLSHIVIIWVKILPISGHRPLIKGLKRPEYGIKNFDPDPKIVGNLDPRLTAYP